MGPKKKKNNNQILIENENKYFISTIEPFLTPLPVPETEVQQVEEGVDGNVFYLYENFHFISDKMFHTSRTEEK